MPEKNATLLLHARLYDIADKLATVRARSVPAEGLFHYTNAAGLIGIVRDEAVWATDYRALNDSQEFRIGLECTDSVISRMKSEAPLDRHQKWLNVLSNMIGFWRSKRFRPFVASFSEKADQLSQWRAYSSQGAGYSLGFSSFAPNVAVISDEGETPFPNPGLHVALLKCTYDSTKFCEVLQKDLEELLVAADRWSDSVRDEVVAVEFATAAGRHITFSIPQLKHEAFREEEEWRLVAYPEDIPTDLVQYRVSTRGLLPYVLVRLSPHKQRLDINRLIVGPTQSDRGMAFATEFMEQKGYKDVSVTHSRAPYSTTLY